MQLKGKVMGRARDDRLVKHDLGLEKLHIVDGLLQHGDCIHLRPTRHHRLQDFEPVTNPVSPLPRSDALRVGRKPHPSPTTASASPLAPSPRRLRLPVVLRQIRALAGHFLIMNKT